MGFWEGFEKRASASGATYKRIFSTEDSDERPQEKQDEVISNKKSRKLRGSVDLEKQEDNSDAHLAPQMPFLGY